MIVMAVAAPLITPTDPYDTQYIKEARDMPSLNHIMGVDSVGRDLWSRIAYGARMSLFVGFAATTISFLIGMPIGALSGFLGGAVDWFIYRLASAITVIPGLLFAILIVSTLGGGVWNTILAVSFTGWVGAYRLVRGQVLSLRERTFVEAARSIGAGTWHIIWKHLVPNSLAPLLVAISFAVPAAITAEAGLSFLGVGVKPPTPTWGAMLSEGLSQMMSAWHLSFFPGLMIGLTLLASSFIGDALRDVLDPSTNVV